MNVCISIYTHKQTYFTYVCMFIKLERETETDMSVVVVVV